MITYDFKPFFGLGIKIATNCYIEQIKKAKEVFLW